MFNILSMELRFEQDIVAVRQRARQIAGLLDFDQLVQTRIATAVSEIARNSFRYAHRGGKAWFSLDNELPQHFWIKIEDQGPGIEKLEEILAGQYHSLTGMGMGIIGAKRLMDRFEIKTSVGAGTTVRLGKLVPANKVLGAKDIAEISRVLAQAAPDDALGEQRQQNVELLQALEKVEKREAELSRLNKELADTNRGIIALNTELEDQALAIKRASEIKSHFLTHMTHEFRTPVNSILSLSRLLTLPSAHDVLSSERLRQVGFIRKAAESLSELVNDILDNAKAEAGRLEIHVKQFQVDDLFGALRSMFRPLMIADRPVELIFADTTHLPLLSTDEGKVAQILRNFISNALKFTDQGRVEVQAQLIGADKISFAVTDSGIGIKTSDQAKIFDDFTQIESPHQRLAKGTGLGLPLARRLAMLLGGRVSLQSEAGRGSTFEVLLPINMSPEAEISEPSSAEQQVAERPVQYSQHAIPQILIIDDDEVSRFVLSNLLKENGIPTIEAENGSHGISIARKYLPLAIFLDLSMPHMSGFEVLDALKSDAETQAIPVIICSSKTLTLNDFKHKQLAPSAYLSKDIFSCENAVQKIFITLCELGLVKPGKARDVSV